MQGWYSWKDCEIFRIGRDFDYPVGRPHDEGSLYSSAPRLE